MRSLAAKTAGLVLAAIVLLLAAAAPASASSATSGTDEQAITDALNDVRTGLGLARLTVDARLVDVARAWSDQMASETKLAHNPSLTSQVPSDWLRVGENVGYAGSVDVVHRLLVESPLHYANMVNPKFNHLGIGVTRSGDRVWVTQVFMEAPIAPTSEPLRVRTPSAPIRGGGYRIVASTGGVYDFATASQPGDVPGGGRIVAGASTPSRNGYWAVSADGAVHARGDAAHLGGLGGKPLAAPIVGMAATPTGKGYWLLGRDGGVFSFGDASFYGSTGDLRLNQPVVAMSASPTGRGYWFAAADGGIFAFGDAGFHGSTGDIRLNQPIRGMAATPSGAGYWLVASDGGIFAFGDAGFHGSTGDIRLNQPIVGVAATATGKGYRFVAADGGVFAFGDAGFAGSAAHIGQAAALVAG